MVARLILFSFVFHFSISGKADAAGQACARIVEAYSFCKADPARGVALNGNNFRLWRNGQTLDVPCADGRPLNFYDRVENMDIASILRFPYLAGDVPLPTDSEAGRLRNLILFKTIYGNDAAEVRANLRTVNFLPNMPLEFNVRNGAANSLEDAGRELQMELRRNPILAREMAPWANGQNRGTFEWRLIAGTQILSSHSFGTAVDFEPVQTGLPEYWRWDPKYDQLPEREIKNFRTPAQIAIFPRRLVEIMEAHGFIWGGKWHHFDSMHFEYRPEFMPNYSPRCE